MAELTFADQAHIMASMKVPPTWSPDWSTRCPFHRWLRDVALWSIATEIPENAQGAAVVLRLGGAAREYADELGAQILQQGQVMDLHDGLGPRQGTGLDVLLRALARNYAMETGEDAIKAMAEMMAFSAQPHEPIDIVLNRFQVLKSRAMDHGLNPGPAGWAWMRMTGLRVQPEE
eukprot:3296755-Pyramimonas_sp.AAC.1